jgi:hypothetical protein
MSNCTHHNTAIISYLVMHTDTTRVPTNTQPAEYKRAALLELYRTVEMERVGDGNGTIVGIYIGVCVCVCAIVQCIRGKCNINKHTHARTQTHTRKWGLQLWRQEKFTEKCHLSMATIV